jgi:TRAP-type C4-dicarboxylate transport system permease small subunit
MKTTQLQSNPIASIASTLSVFFERLAAYPCIVATGGMTFVVLLGVFYRYVLSGQIIGQILRLLHFILPDVLMQPLLLVFRWYLQFAPPPLSWSEEVARYLMIWAASLAISIGIMKREHLGITFFISKFPRSLQKYAAVLVNICVLWFLWVLTKFGYFMAVEGKTQLSPILSQYGKITMMWPLASIPVAGGLAMIQTLLQILIDLFGKKEELDIKGMVDI